MNRGWQWRVLLGLLVAATAAAQTAGPVVGFKQLRLPAGGHELDPRLTAFPLDSGLITSVTDGRLFCDAARWETNRWANHRVLIASGSTAGLTYSITQNSVSQLAVEPNPLHDNLTLTGARFEIVPNLEDDFGGQLAAGDGVGIAGAQTNAPPMIWKDADGQWYDVNGNPATLTLLPGQSHRLVPQQDRAVVITGRVLWQAPYENNSP